MAVKGLNAAMQALKSAQKAETQAAKAAGLTQAQIAQIRADNQAERQTTRSSIKEAGVPLTSQDAVQFFNTGLTAGTEDALGGLLDQFAGTQQFMADNGIGARKVVMDGGATTISGGLDPMKIMANLYDLPGASKYTRTSDLVDIAQTGLTADQIGNLKPVKGQDNLFKYNINTNGEDYMNALFSQDADGAYKMVGADNFVYQAPKTETNLLSALAPLALNYFLPGLGSAIGSGLGLSGTAATMAGNALLNGTVAAVTGGNPLLGAAGGAVGGYLQGFDNPIFGQGYENSFDTGAMMDTLGNYNPSSGLSGLTGSGLSGFDVPGGMSIPGEYGPMSSVESLAPSQLETTFNNMGIPTGLPGSLSVSPDLYNTITTPQGSFVDNVYDRFTNTNMADVGTSLLDYAIANPGAVLTAATIGTSLLGDDNTGGGGTIDTRPINRETVGQFGPITGLGTPNSWDFYNLTPDQRLQQRLAAMAQGKSYIGG